MSCRHGADEATVRMVSSRSGVDFGTVLNVLQGLDAVEAAAQPPHPQTAWPVSTAWGRPMPPCPVCGEAVRSASSVATAGACLLSPCGHAAEVTVWPDEQRIVLRAIGPGRTTEGGEG